MKKHTRTRRADHLRQGLLADFRYDWLRPTFLAKIRQKQKGPCQPFLARIEQLIIRTITHSVIAETVPRRSGCPVKHPSPKKSPVARSATTASFPCSERTVFLTLPL